MGNLSRLHRSCRPTGKHSQGCQSFRIFAVVRVLPEALVGTHYLPETGLRAGIGLQSWRIKYHHSRLGNPRALRRRQSQLQELDRDEEPFHLRRCDAVGQLALFDKRWNTGESRTSSYNAIPEHVIIYVVVTEQSDTVLLSYADGT